MDRWNKISNRAKGAWTCGVQIRKTSYAVISFGFISLLLLFYMLSMRIQNSTLNTVSATFLLIGVTTSIVSIQSAFSLIRQYEHMQQFEQTVNDLESLNKSMRSQRHDFINHIQVVSALIEMKEYDEAKDYIEKINHNMQIIGDALKTSLPAVNALLLAKTTICNQKKIALDLDVKTSLSALPIASWQLCQILGNLIDNAIDALESDPVPYPRISLQLFEDLFDYYIIVGDNGREIPLHIQKKMFEDRFSTKSGDRGTGLTIVGDIVASCKGTLEMKSTEGLTVFRVLLPILSDQK